MVETLRNNPLRIHSYQEFEAALGCPIPKLFPVGLIAAGSDPETAHPALPADRAKLVRQDVRVAGNIIRKISKSELAAVRKANNPPRCLREPCAKTLKTLTRPAILKFELRMAKAQRGAAAATDSAKEQAKLNGMGTAALVKYVNKQEARNRKRIARAALAGVRDILKAARPVFKIDDSRFTKKAHKALSKAAARFRKATRKGGKGLPASLTLPAVNPREGSHGTPRIPTPTPTPVPTPTNFRTLTSMGLDQCEPQVAEPKEIEVSGTLNVAPAGSPVEVDFRSPGGGLVRAIVKSEPGGKWSAKHMPVQGETGLWQVSASYAGDSTYAASSSPTCQVDYLNQSPGAYPLDRGCRLLLLGAALGTAVATEDRRQVPDQGADRDRDEEDDDQRRVDVDEEDVDADLLGVLQGDDQDERDEGPDSPGAPVPLGLLGVHRRSTSLVPGRREVLEVPGAQGADDQRLASAKPR